MIDKELVEKDLVLTYRFNRSSGKMPQIDLEGLWSARDVDKMARSVMREARRHKQELLKQMKGMKDDTGKPKSKRKSKQ